MSEQNNIYVNEFSDEEMDDFASALNSVIETFCKFSDKHNFDRDNIIAFVAEKLYQFSEIATVKHYKVNDQTTTEPVRHGKWINTSGYDDWYCSKCDFEISFDGYYPTEFDDFKYCGRCGAKMG